MNYLIGGSINSGKMEVVNGLLESGEVSMENIIHGDILRKELYDSLTINEKEKYFPKMHRIFTGEIKGIDLIEELGSKKSILITRTRKSRVWETYHSATGRTGCTYNSY